MEEEAERHELRTDDDTPEGVESGPLDNNSQDDRTAGTIPAPPMIAREAPPAEAAPLSYEDTMKVRALDAVPGQVLEDDPAKVFTVGVWGPVGMMKPNYCCRECNFNTVSGVEVFLIHYKARHIDRPKEVQTRPRSGLVGLNGQPL